MLSTTLDEMQRLNKKLNGSLLLESMFNIDWSEGNPVRYSQTKHMGREQQTYKSWIQQGDKKTMLTHTQYEKLSGIKLNQDQIINWSTK
tara:strand:- start:613 stop:879 length:267 start_codon:yes stop_codon:yes gene_type:complete